MEIDNCGRVKVIPYLGMKKDAAEVLRPFGIYGGQSTQTVPSSLTEMVMPSLT